MCDHRLGWKEVVSVTPDIWHCSHNTDAQNQAENIQFRVQIQDWKHMKIQMLQANAKGWVMSSLQAMSIWCTCLKRISWWLLPWNKLSLEHVHDQDNQNYFTTVEHHQLWLSLLRRFYKCWLVAEHCYKCDIVFFISRHCSTDHLLESEGQGWGARSGHQESPAMQENIISCWDKPAQGNN